MKYNQEELETFLIEADLINQKVKALAQNKISTEEIDKFAQQRLLDRKKRQEAQSKKEQELYKKKLMGRDGKGITKDFSSFCRLCHKQYELETPKCKKCNRPTMTLEERQTQLQHMVQQYKYDKKTREEKRHKWEMFQKTQAAVWKKSSINYNKKWQYFVQDSDQEPQNQPILPKHDPNFMALEADIEQRKKKRAQDTQKAKRLKDKGNNSMKQGDYQKAMQYYTLALQHIKDIKSIYTNRALAFIKLKKFKKAIKDCTNVIEYMQIFQKVGQSKDLAFKGYSRRAWAKKQIKEYKQALQDIKQALKLSPEDKNGLVLKKQIEGFIQHSQTVEKLIRQNKQKQQQQAKKQEEIMQQNKAESDSEGDQQKFKRMEKQIIKQIAENQLQQQKNSSDQKKKQTIPKNPQVKQKEQNPITAIPQKLKNLNEQNVQYLLNLLIVKRQYKSIFISSKGIQLTLDYLTENQSPKNEALLISICLEGDGVGQKRVWDWGVFRIYQLIISKFQDQTKLSLSLYGFIDNLLMILVPLSLSDGYRPILASSPKTFQFIEYLFSKIITKHKKQPRLLDNFFTFFSNLCSGESALKNGFLKKEKLSVILDSFYLMILDHKTKNREVLDLKQTIYSLIANIVTNQQHRKFFDEFLIKNNKLNDLKQQVQSYPRTAHNFQPYMQNVLSVLANATIDGRVQAGEISDAIFNRFIANWQKYNTTIVFRSLLTLGRFNYTSNKQLKQWMKVFDIMALKIDPLVVQQDKYIAQVVKILNVLFLVKEPQAIENIPDTLLKSLTKFIKQNAINQQLFCNSCNLFGIILDQKNSLTEKLLLTLRPLVAKLVQVAKERIGNWRKSAAILLGKCSFDAQCREQLNKHHGMEVLQSIASFVTTKK